MNQQILFKRMHPSVRLPFQGSDGAACWDIYAHAVVLNDAAARATIHTGLRVAFPNTMVMCLFARSGLGANYGLVPANGTGIIDSDYRGEIIIKFRDLSPEALDRLNLMEDYARNDEPERVVQALFLPVIMANLREVLELPETVRGAGGFGSTG